MIYIITSGYAVAMLHQGKVIAHPIERVIVLAASSNEKQLTHIVDYKLNSK